MKDSVLSVSPEAVRAMETIDSERFFYLYGKGDGSVSRTKLFMVASAMGLTSAPIPLSKKQSIIRSSYIDGRDKALLTATYISTKLDSGEELDDIDDLGKIICCIEPYANSGLLTLGSYATEKSNEILLREWVVQLDEHYKELFGDEGEQEYGFLEIED